jgi:O-antigen/teichoic acid export membrane protein
MSGLHRASERARATVAAASTDQIRAIRSLTRGGVALLANSALTAIFGVVFWLVAARLLTTTTVGRASGLVSTLLTVSALCQLNYARSLSRLIPLAERPRKLLANAYGITIAISIAGGLVFAYVFPHFSAEFSYLRADVVFIACFGASVAIQSIFNLEDAALTSVRRATIMPFENGGYGILKIICLVALWRFGYRSSVALFVSWVLPLIVVVIPVNLYLFLRAVPTTGIPRIQQKAKSLPWLRYDFAGYLLWLAGTLPLPVLVLTTVGAAKSASFYVAFTIAQAIDILSLNLGNTLTAELSRTRGSLTSETRRWLIRVWGGVGLLSAFVFIVAPEVLQVFGDKYKVGGTIILRTFMVAALPRSVLFIGIAILRSRERGRSILLLQAIASLGTLGLGVALAHALGAFGTALGWLLASCVAVLVMMLLLVGTPRAGSHHRSMRVREVPYPATPGNGPAPGYGRPARRTAKLPADPPGNGRPARRTAKLPADPPANGRPARRTADPPPNGRPARRTADPPGNGRPARRTAKLPADPPANRRPDGRPRPQIF